MRLAIANEIRLCDAAIEKLRKEIAAIEEKKQFLAGVMKDEELISKANFIKLLCVSSLGMFYDSSTGPAEQPIEESEEDKKSETKEKESKMPHSRQWRKTDFGRIPRMTDKELKDRIIHNSSGRAVPLYEAASKYLAQQERKGKSTFPRLCNTTLRYILYLLTRQIDVSIDSMREFMFNAFQFDSEETRRKHANYIAKYLKCVHRITVPPEKIKEFKEMHRGDDSLFGMPYREMSEEERLFALEMSAKKEKILQFAINRAGEPEAPKKAICMMDNYTAPIQEVNEYVLALSYIKELPWEFMVTTDAGYRIVWFGGREEKLLDAWFDRAQALVPASEREKLAAEREKLLCEHRETKKKRFGSDKGGEET